MYKEALIRLADKLEGVGPYVAKGPVRKEQFDMGCWVKDAKVIHNKVLNHWVARPELPCGTAACAAGWAGVDPWFRKRGLYATKDDIMYRDPKASHPYITATGIHALEHFFDLDRLSADTLFMPYRGNRTTKNVARHIRKFVKNEEKLEKQREAAQEL